MLRTSDLDYDLPPDRIAVRPAEPRDAARLMVIARGRATVEHHTIRDLPGLLRPGDLLVTNASRVLPARFLGVREDSGGRVEGLYLREGPRPGTWIAMLKARRFPTGAKVRLLLPDGRPSPFTLTLTNDAQASDSARLVELHSDAGSPQPTPAILAAVGLPPIPPYILAARRSTVPEPPSNPPSDTASYQTVFAGGLLESADHTELGSVAAPTAGLHFTPDLLARLTAAGIERTQVVLHVGPGTFKPVDTAYVEDHPMHAEWCMMPAHTAAAIARTRNAGGRVVCVGTTSARTVEAFARHAADANPPADWLHTRLLITPGFNWRSTDALLTNFHLPRSTLMALVASLLPRGIEQLQSLYADAIAHGYRFYSYGDAMLII